jgi:hypothetical protein
MEGKRAQTYFAFKWLTSVKLINYKRSETLVTKTVGKLANKLCWISFLNSSKFQVHIFINEYHTNLCTFWGVDSTPSWHKVL